MNLKYRSEIDGLRAIAVIPVVFFHAGFNFFSGGFVGVDVFFVISGYLITTIILRELENKNFSIANFYERRVRRILPVLIFVIFVTSILSFVFLTRSELASYFKSVNATLLFYSNFHFWETAPYFRSESELEPLLHTWSLSIEEQFYIIFPLMLTIVYKYFKKYIIIFFYFSFFSSLFLCHIIALKTGGAFNFYFTLSRIWELALGGISAYYLLNNKIIASKNLKNLYSIFGLILILFSIFFFNRQTLYPSFYTLAPTIGTTLIILFASKETYVRTILSSKILVAIGLISYSFYLWHQPLLAFGKIYFNDFSNELKFASILISLLLSILTYNFIEKFFRNKNKVNFKLLFRTSTLSIFFIFLFSQLNVNFFSTVNSTEVLLAKLLSDNEAIYSTKMDDRQFIRNRILHETLDPKILVIGSSRIMQISNDNFKEQVLNLGVGGGSIEDHIAITAMALEKFNPNMILLGVDPWLFNVQNDQYRWESFSKEYQLALENIQLMNNNNKVLKYYSSNYKYNFYEKFLENFYVFLNKRNLKFDLKSNKIENNQRDIILRDGKRVYGKKSNKEKIKAKVVEYSMYKYEFSKKNHDIYKKFIKYLVDVKKKKVVLVLTPYHQSSYELTIQAKPVYLNLENKFRKISEETNVQIVGSYNSLLVSCNESQFYDITHPNDICMHKITKQIR